MSGTLEILSHATLEELQTIRGGKVGQLKNFSQWYLDNKGKRDHYAELAESNAMTIQMLETELSVVDRMIEEKRKSEKRTSKARRQLEDERK
jgi:hypothetical protein